MQFARLESREDIMEVIRWHNKYADYVVFDTETTDKDPRKAVLIDIQIEGMADSPYEAVMFSAEHAACLEHLEVPLVAHNAKYDLHVLFRHGVDLRDKEIRDTILMSRLADENRISHSLDSWVQELYRDCYKEKFWNDFQSYEAAPEARRLDYACRDVVYTERLYVELCARLAQDGVPESLLQLSGRLDLALLDTEIYGVAVDVPYLLEKGVELAAKSVQQKHGMRTLCEGPISAIEFDMWAEEMDKRKTAKGKSGVVKPEFNFDSSKQLKELLYDHLKLEPQYNEKTRAISVDDASLEKLQDAHPLVSQLREYRDTAKIYGTYIQGTLERQQEGRIYPSFRVNGTATGRLTHSNPNLGQLPKSGGIRGIYRPDPGEVLISADYGQLEVVLAAHFSHDKNLLRIVNEGTSQHDITADSLGIERHAAKTLNFAMQYRCGAGKVSKLLGIGKDEGELIWRKYWETYSGLKKLMDECDAKINRGEPIRTPFGRLRRFEHKKRSPWDKAYRQATNALIQGTGADLTSLAYLRTHETLKVLGIGRGWFSVHDELLVVCQKDYYEEARAVIMKNMKQVGVEIGLTLELKVDVSEGMLQWED